MVVKSKKKLMLALAVISTAGYAFDALSWSPREYLRREYQSVPWIRDPFHPFSPRFKLNGLITGEMAFINEKWWKLNERIDGYSITHIDTQSVLLSRGDERIKIQLQPSDMREKR